jgi:predicted O-linked N-acetylglucosamine transferase (SPINDLY family)
MHSNLIFTLHYHPGYDFRTISDEQQRWNRQFSEPLQMSLQPYANDPGGERPLRIGYVSADFRDHAVGRFLLPLFERHDRERFEIFCYSGVSRPDKMTERLRALTGPWRPTFGVPDDRLAEIIREDRVDILVDLSLHSGGNRLPVFARQPAPVQLSWLGYPGSAGIPAIGYRLTDACMDPPGSRSRGTAGSAGELLRLPNCWCCYQPAEDAPEIASLPALSARKVTFGSLNHFSKVHEGVLARWAGVLEAVNGSRLLFPCPEGIARERVRAFFGARGIAGERLELVNYLPRSEFLRLYERIDIGLDTFPYNGMATTCDALWMGTPVLTLPGEMPASRAGLSLLSCVGLGELVAHSEEDYVRLATELAANLSRLAELRASLRGRMLASPLMDAPTFARDVEAAYRSMWRRWRRTKDGV